MGRSFMLVLLTVAFSLVGLPASQAQTCASKPVQEFRATYTDSSSLSQYAGVIHAERMAIVADPVVRNSRKVLRMQSAREDIGPTSDPRAQISSPGNPLTECVEFWTSFSVYLPSMSAADKLALEKDPYPHINYAQVYGPPFLGSAPLLLEQIYDKSLGGHLISLRTSVMVNGVETKQRIWTAPLKNNTWLNFAIHMKMSRDPAAGFVEVYHSAGVLAGAVKQKLFNGSKIYRYQTLHEANFSPTNPVGNRVDQQVYRPARLEIPWVTAYFASFKIVRSGTQALSFR